MFNTTILYVLIVSTGASLPATQSTFQETGGGCTSVATVEVTGRVLGSDRRLVPSTISLHRPGYRPPIPVVTTIPATSGLINLQTPGKGLYTIRVEAEGYESLEFPILLETQGAHGLEFRPRKRGISGTAPVCSDARLVAWEAIHQAQKARHGRKGKAGSLDWKPDLTTLRKAIDSEQDPLTRSFLVTFPP